MAVTLKVRFDEGETVLALVEFLLDPVRRGRLNDLSSGCIDLSWGPRGVAGGIQVKSVPLGDMPRPIRRHGALLGSTAQHHPDAPP